MQEDHRAGRPVRISRRAAIRGLLTGSASLVLLAACGVPAAANLASAARGAVSQASSTVDTSAQQATQPSCVITPQQTEGPYFVDERLTRSDIRTDPSDGTLAEGVPLRLDLRVSQVAANACTPLSGVYVDIWQCDALGNYSDEKDMNGLFDTRGKMFLRGGQITDENGAVQFTTIYPGWYQGRTVHIHFKVRTALDAQSGHEMTSQFYFDDAITDRVHALQPYAQKGERTLRNDRDGIYRQGGSQLLLPLVEEGEGYTATFNLGLQLT